VLWKVDQKRQVLRLGLQVATTGWVGFGLGEPTSGSMPGADLVIVSFESGAPEVKDAYATAFATPTYDTCQDWRMLSASQAGGYSEIELERDLTTGDSQDRDIVIGPNKVLYAYGLASQPALQYHQARRGMSEITFWADPAEELTLPYDPQEASAVLSLGGFLVPAQKTTYVCSAHIIPLSPDAPDNHVIQIDPVIDPVSVEIAHHMIVHICDNNTEDSYVNTYFNNPGQCNSPVGDTTRGCRSLLYTWGNLFSLSPHSFRLSPPGGWLPHGLGQARL